MYNVGVFLPQLLPETYHEIYIENNGVQIHQQINFHMLFFPFWFSLAKISSSFSSQCVQFFLNYLLSTSNHVFGDKYTEKTISTVTSRMQKEDERTGKKCQANLLDYFQLPRRQQQAEKKLGIVLDY